MMCCQMCFMISSLILPATMHSVTGNMIMFIVWAVSICVCIDVLCVKNLKL